MKYPVIAIKAWRKGEVQLSIAIESFAPDGSICRRLFWRSITFA